LALETGAFQSAMVTFIWLYENEKDPNRQLQDLARASVSAARAGDRAEFARTFRLLAGQEDRLEPSDKRGDKKGDKKSDKKGDRNGERRGDRGEAAVAAARKPE